jgi:hypothetical protein
MNARIPSWFNGKFVREMLSGKWNEMAPIKIEDRVIKIKSFEYKGVPIGTKGTIKANVLIPSHGWQFWVKWDTERNPVLVSFSNLKKEGADPL